MRLTSILGSVFQCINDAGLGGTLGSSGRKISAKLTVNLQKGHCQNLAKNVGINRCVTLYTKWRAILFLICPEVVPAKKALENVHCKASLHPKQVTKVLWEFTRTILLKTTDIRFSHLELWASFSCVLLLDSVRGCSNL